MFLLHAHSPDSTANGRIAQSAIFARSGLKGNQLHLLWQSIKSIVTNLQFFLL
jgi:hypothetical protein